MQTHNVRFAASLSNGKNYLEDKGDIIGDETASSWTKLLRIMLDEKATITSFSLYAGEKIFHLPSAGSNPKFAFLKPMKPVDYNFMRAIAQEMSSTGGGLDKQVRDWYTVAEAVYVGFKLQIWVNETDTNDCRTVITQ